MFFFILAYENIVEQKRMEIKFQRRMKATQVAYSKSIRTLLFFVFFFRQNNFLKIGPNQWSVN